MFSFETRTRILSNATAASCCRCCCCWMIVMLLLSFFSGGCVGSTSGNTLAGAIVSATCSNKCVRSSADEDKSSQPVVVQWDCDGSDERQKWNFEPVGTAFRIKTSSSSSLSCLTIQEGSYAPGALAVLDNCTDQRPEQLWHVSGSGDYRKLRPSHTLQCLKIRLAARNNGALLLQWPCTDSMDEHWRIDAHIIIPTLPSFWEGPYGLPLVAVAAATLPDGKILTWSAYKRFDWLGIGVGKTYTTIFDPETQTNSEALVQNTNHDMFCPGTAQLGDGRIMITGGSDSNATTIYDPATNTWSMGPQTIIPRGYHSMTVLSDGSVFTLGGSWSGGQGNKTGEVWNVSTEEWTVKSNILGETLLTNDSQGLYRSDNHMWLQVAPNGRIFHAGPSTRMHWIDIERNGAVEESVLRGDDTDAMNGNAIMYDIGKILTLGGAPYYENSPSSKRAYVVTLDGNKASVERVGDMSYQRSFSSSVVLPTGEVVVVGGMSWSFLFSDEGSVRTAELWNPTTKKFSMLAEMTVPRNYHSIAILLKDGRVMSAGSGLCGNCTVNHNDTEILTPPYLLNLDQSAATRPVILLAPSTIIPGETVELVMDSAGPHSFALVRTSVVTHAVNNDQRRIPLEVINVKDNTFTLSIPANPNVVLPGNYFLFAMNDNNVPSIAQVVNRPNRCGSSASLTKNGLVNQERLGFSSAATHTQASVKFPPAVIKVGATSNVALFVVILMCSIPFRRKLFNMAAQPALITTTSMEDDDDDNVA